MAAETVPLSRLRPLWLALPELPWLASLLPFFAPPFSWAWIVLVFYFMPAYQVARAAGYDAALSWGRDGPLLVPYCLLVALLLELAMRWVGRRHGVWRRIRRRAAALAVLAVAVAWAGLLGLRYAQWIDWPARPAAADHPLYALRDRAAQIHELLVYELPGGFIDREYVARIRGGPDLLPQLIESLPLERVPEDRVPADFWSAPAAWWWRPPRAGEFYATHDYPWTGRGRDGEHSCFLHVPDTGELWLWQKSNF